MFHIFWRRLLDTLLSGNFICSQEKNMVMFYDNNTKVGGICGELWYLLADYLNFTFVPIKTTNRDFGQRTENGSYKGLVGMLARDEVQVILRSGFFKARMNVVDYTIPLWKSTFHIYVQPERLYDNKWVFTLFSPKTWYSIVFLFIIISCVGYFLQKIPTDSKRKKKDCTNFSLGDHFFHSFAMMCAQGYIPDAYHNKFKILSLSKSIFAWLVLLAFSSHLIYRMTNRETTLPFTDIETLFNSTKYVLLAFRGSFLFNYLHNKYGNNTTGQNQRIHFIDIAEEMHRKICDSMKNYALFEIEDRFMALNRYGCSLQSIGNYNQTWITFALKKDFRYKKTIDSTLIKFNEVGIMDALKDRWLNIRLENKEQNKFKTIDLHQVHLIFLILCCGILISFTILILENIKYYYDTKNVRRRRRR
nr:PREDICTED: uncharacterized protein LOC105673398 [Linepithema humile]